MKAQARLAFVRFLAAAVAVLAAGCLGGSPPNAPDAQAGAPSAWSPSGLPEPEWDFRMPPLPESTYNHSQGGWQRGPDLPAGWGVVSAPSGNGTYQFILDPGFAPLVGPREIDCGAVGRRTAADVGKHAVWTSEEPGAFPLGSASAIQVRPREGSTFVGLDCPRFLVGNGTAVDADAGAGAAPQRDFTVLEDGGIRLDDGTELGAGQTAERWSACPDDGDFGVSRNDCAVIERVFHLGAWDASRVWFAAPGSLPPSG